MIDLIKENSSVIPSVIPSVINESVLPTKIIEFNQYIFFLVGHILFI